MPKNNEEELRLGMDLVSQLDENKEKFWEIVKSYSGEMETDSDTFKSKINSRHNFFQKNFF